MSKEEDISNYMTWLDETGEIAKMMEEIAKRDKEEVELNGGITPEARGIRQPGEMNSYEKQRKETGCGIVEKEAFGISEKEI